MKVFFFGITFHENPLILLFNINNVFIRLFG